MFPGLFFAVKIKTLFKVCLVSLWLNTQMKNLGTQIFSNTLSIQCQGMLGNRDTNERLFTGALNVSCTNFDISHSFFQKYRSVLGIESLI